MLIQILMIFFSLSVTKAEPSGSFTAAEYFEAVRSTSNKSRWPARVTFQRVNIPADEFEFPAVWRLVIACSGRAIREQALESGPTFMAIGPVKDLSGVVQIANPLAAKSGSERSLNHRAPSFLSTFFDFEFRADSDGNILVYDRGFGLDYRAHIISEQGAGEVIFIAEPRGLPLQMIQPLCESESPQIVLAREPNS